MVALQSLADLTKLAPEHGDMCFVAAVDNLYVYDAEHDNGEGAGGHWFRVGMVETPMVTAPPPCCSNCGAPPVPGASCRYCGASK